MLKVEVKDAETGQPVDAASVSAQSRYGMAQAIPPASTDKSGTAALRLLPGKYLLRISAEPFHLAKSIDTAIEVNEGATAEIGAALSPRPSIHGVLRDSDGKPAAGVEIGVSSNAGSESVTDADGKFRIMTFGDTPKNCAIMARSAERHLCAWAMVTDVKLPIEMTLTPGRTLAGRVTSANGKPIPRASATVHCTSATGAFMPFSCTATPDAAGNVEIDALPETSEYSIEFSTPGFGPHIEKIAVDDPGKKKYDFPPITLAPAELTLSGVVVDSDDKPVAKAVVEAGGSDQPMISAVITDDAGKFTLRGLVKGRVNIDAQIRDGELRGALSVETDEKDIKIVMWKAGGAVSSMQIPLMGGALPDLTPLGVKLAPEQTNDKALLVCFFDMNQRPSRHLISALAEKLDVLAKQNVVLVAVQASPADDAALKSFAEKIKLAIPPGMIKTDEEKTRAAWGVQSLPWLILTDRDHIVRAEGFGVDELDEKVKSLSPTDGAGK